jgi:hypothetical protein
MTRPEPCWFCKTRDSAEETAAAVKMERIVNLPSNGWDLESIEVKVPRCVPCRRGHRLAGTASFFSWIGAGVVALMTVSVGTIFSMAGYHAPVIIPIKPAGLMGMFAAIALPAFGIPLLIGFAGAAIGKAIFLGSALPESAGETFDLVDQRKKEGWKLPGEAV